MRFLKYILLLLIVGSFSTCKKYPENRLWTRHPQKYFNGGVITAYTENGIDIMPKIRNWYSDFPYNYYGQKIDDVFTLPFSYDKATDEFTTDYGAGYFHFNSDGKTVDISFTPKNSLYGAQNLFVENENWQILKLTKSGQMKLKVTMNYKYYEIQFN